MPFASALSTHPDSMTALRHVCEAASLGAAAELVVAFFTPHHLEAASRLADHLAERFTPRALFGCVGESIVGTGREVEHQPALSLWLGSWKGTIGIESFHLQPQRTPDGLSLLGWPDGLVEAVPAEAVVLIVGDPFTFPAAEVFLPQINEDATGLRVFGGMASGMPGPGQTALIHGTDVSTIGAVGVLLTGPTGIRGVVSQGCRPIGRPWIVTRAEENVIIELGGRTPLDVLRELYRELDARDKELFQQGPHLGLVIDEYRESFQRGDFLIRNLLRLDRESGALAIGDRVRIGQTVQFQVRDADTADEDWRVLLRQDRQAHADRRVAASLLFTCNGRGTRLFGSPDHDARVLSEELGAVPTAGLFAAGEIGPIGRHNFLHGFTASAALFTEPVE